MPATITAAITVADVTTPLTTMLATPQQNIDLAATELTPALSVSAPVPRDMMRLLNSHLPAALSEAELRLKQEGVIISTESDGDAQGESAATSTAAGAGAGAEGGSEAASSETESNKRPRLGGPGR